jgi:phosphohistidine phosphatase
MKTIILARHAKAVSHELRIPDFERSLLKRGIKDAKNIAKILKAEGIKPDLFISSPANRALETAHIFAKELQYPIQKILIKDELYNEPSADKILTLVQGVGERHSSVMIFGHNPSFDEFAAFLLKNFRKSISTSGVVGIQFNNKLWKSINKANGKLRFHEQPIHKSEKSQIYKEATRGIETKIAKQVNQIFSGIDKQAADKISDLVSEHSRKLVNKFLKASKTYKVKRISNAMLKTQKPKKRTRSTAAQVSGKKKATNQEENKAPLKSKKIAQTNPSVKSTAKPKK